MHPLESGERVRLRMLEASQARSPHSHHIHEIRLRQRADRRARQRGRQLARTVLPARLPGLLAARRHEVGLTLVRLGLRLVDPAAATRRASR